jgi:hypothetical protein
MKFLLFLVKVDSSSKADHCMFFADFKRPCFVV